MTNKPALLHQSPAGIGAVIPRCADVAYRAAKTNLESIDKLFGKTHPLKLRLGIDVVNLCNGVRISRDGDCHHHGAGDLSLRPADVVVQLSLGPLDFNIFEH